MLSHIMNDKTMVMDIFKDNVLYHTVFNSRDICILLNDLSVIFSHTGSIFFSSSTLFTMELGHFLPDDDFYYMTDEY